jgi:hypothetical protein
MEHIFVTVTTLSVNEQGTPMEQIQQLNDFNCIVYKRAVASKIGRVDLCREDCTGYHPTQDAELEYLAFHLN